MHVATFSWKAERFLLTSEVMCGIIGYIGKQDVASILFNGLKRLEYRGYDSAGIATLASGFHIKKDIGKVNPYYSTQTKNTHNDTFVMIGLYLILWRFNCFIFRIFLT